MADKPARIELKLLLTKKPDETLAEFKVRVRKEFHDAGLIKETGGKGSEETK